LNWESPYASALAGCLNALSHLGLPHRMRARHGASGARPRDMQPWLRHAGLMGGAPRSMSGLEALLADRLGLRVSGKQFVGHWRTVEHGDSARLGSAKAHGSRVGGVHVLGRRVWDQAAGICIEFHDLPRAQFIALLPGGDAHELAVWLIHRYVQQDFEVQFVLHPAPQPVSCALSGNRHGASAVRLGWTSWLTAGRDAGAVHAGAAGARRADGDANTPAAGRTAHASKARLARAPAPVRFSARASSAQRA
jgi:type VI secretion system protein ImpH